MYTPSPFKSDRTASLAFAEARGFGLACAWDGAKPVASSLPFYLTSANDGTPRALFHVARHNPLIKLADGTTSWLLAVNGADAYVSPDWYVSPDQVPTWLYQAVHLTGPVRAMEQAVHVLLRNAFDAMPSGGRLTLTTRVSLNPLFGKMDLGAGQRNMVEAKVADEGGGIPAAARARIFDPFFTTKDKGLGLGLAICHRILEEHRGAIQVDSAEGRGTVVTCFLPIAKMTP